MKQSKNSTTVVAMPDLQAVEDTAALWVMRLEDEDLSGQQKAALQAWLTASDRHATAFNRLAKLWGVLDSVEILADYKVANDRMPVVRPQWQAVTWAAAASFLLVALGALLFLGLGRTTTVGSEDYASAYTTGIGQHKTIELPDGSRINLNTDSTLEIAYSATAREVQLSRGEAYFTVAKDAYRPFSVSTERGVVTAVGTAFTIRVLATSVDLVVAEGVVSLDFPVSKDIGAKSAGISSPNSAVTVTAGQSVVFDGASRVMAEIPIPVIERKLSWREGMLDFDGEPLREVLSDVGRYTQLVIEIEDDSLGDFPVAGRFKIGEIDALLEALEIMAGVNIERIGPGHVRLTK